MLFRSLPKTGFYKGTPFYGSQVEREKLRQTIQSVLDMRIENVYHWPQEWYEIDPELYSKLYMEKPGSVHLSPEFYEWDLLHNAPNYEGLVIVNG